METGVVSALEANVLRRVEDRFDAHRVFPVTTRIFAHLLVFGAVDG
ncbi:MAG TPA: hypothetical protein VMB51_13370 [Solirubrobacteraceae bacterium]|nr:hypothetical protein [Solirubrobacteraceae bacterium]